MDRTVRSTRSPVSDDTGAPLPTDFLTGRLPSGSLEVTPKPVDGWGATARVFPCAPIVV
jgi:hypothetical protein